MSTFSSFLQSASSFISTSNINSNYTLASNLPSTNSNASVKIITVGVWRVERAVHNSNNKVISIWTAEKAGLVRGKITGSSGNPSRGDIAVEVLKKEASSLSRLRHPCILEMTEPMEESRSSITFATEPITASLRHAISASATSESSRSSRRNSTKEEDDLELDEVEIQKGLSQVAKGLVFLHESAKLAHNNLTLDSIIINSKGDWKLSGFGLSTYLFDSQGAPAKWEFPSHDHSMSSCVQRDYDYIAPEYILDESAPAPANDLYSLGCILHAIHTKSGPPFSNHNSLQRARTNIEEGLSGSGSLLKSQWRKLSEEAQSVLSQLVTRYPSNRLSATNFLAHSYFSSLLVSTLRYLERDSFAAQNSEAQAGFLKGLMGVLPRFSDKVNRRKVLPSLLEETRKAGLVPFLLPNILYIGAKLEPEIFRAEVLPELKSLFNLKEPPQAVIALLENLPIFAEKCALAVFRDEVMPLVYNALESDNPAVLEKALRVVPGLSETLDYTTVKQTLFPKITAVFSKTTMLAVKVNTLICFHSMIKTLDTFILTEKLVPLLAKIKTKEPSVMIATLAVHEEIGKKCAIEAIATLILPQLWALSVGPLLNADQFAKFMKVIKTLAARVETEHSQHLAEVQRLEQSSNSAGGVTSIGGRSPNGVTVGGGINSATDFESLVRGGVGATKKAVQQDMWDDDSPSASGTLTPNMYSTPSISPSFSPQNSASRQLPSTQRTNSSLGAKSISPASFNSNAFSSPPLPPPPPFSSPPMPSYSSFPVVTSPSLPPTTSGLNSFVALQPSSRSNTPLSKLQQPPQQPIHSSTSSYGSGKSNYNISLPPQAPSPSPYTSQLPPLQPQTQSQSNYGMQPLQPTSNQGKNSNSWNVIPPSSSSSFGVLVPTVIDRNVNKVTPSFGDWADLDPLK